MFKYYFAGLLLLQFSFAVFSSGLAQEVVDESATLQKVVNAGLDYLRETGQEADGKFSPRMGSGITSLAVTAALRLGRPLDDPLIARGLQALESYLQPDSGIYGSDWPGCTTITILLAVRSGHPNWI